MMEGEEKKGKCPSCEGKIRPLVTCDICGFSTVREELEPVREEETCPVCEVPAKVVFECEECGDTYPFSKIVPEEERKLVCPMCGAFVDPDAKNCSSCGSSFAVEETEKIAVEKDRLRKKRRVVGEFEEEDIQEIMRIPGVGRLRAEILCKAGYTSLAKLNRASVEDLARVRQIGQRTAKSIKEALQLMYVEPIESQRLLEELIEEEFECPVCKTIVSAYDGECYECGSIFEREVFDEGFVKEIEKVGEEKSSLSLFDMKLLDNPEDAELWVARGALLKKMGNYKEALKSYDRAIEVRPGLKSAWIAKAEILTNLGKFEEAASCYRGIVDESATAAGIEFGEREEAVVALEELAMEDCPSCGSPIPLGSRKCPSCGLKLIPEEEAIIPPEEAFEEEIVPEKVPKRKRAKRRPVKVKRKVTKAPGLTNGRGMVNGKGKINGTGLVNGKGLVNGRGLVNGKGVVNGRGRVNGLINGNGFINGMSLTEMRRVTRRRMWPRYVVLAMAFFILAMGLYGIVPPAEKPTTPISIDGDFTDWQGVSLYSDQNQGANPNTTIATYGIRSDDGYLSFLVGVQGTALGDATGYDSFYVFMDGDDNPDTGYIVRGLGADYMVEVFGGSGEVEGVPVYAYTDNQDRYNFTRFHQVGKGKAAVSGDRLEGQVTANGRLDLNDDFRVLFCADDFDGAATYSSAIIGPTYGALLVTQEPFADNMVVNGSSVNILRLTFEAVGANVQVNGVQFDVSGAQVLSLGSFAVSVSTPEIVPVQVDTSASQDGGLITISVSNIDSDKPSALRGSGAKAYFVSSPAGVRIDGWFGDWAGMRLEDDTDGGPMINPNTNIQKFNGTKNATGDIAHFYLQVEGQLLGGFSSPQTRQKTAPSEGEGGPGGPAARRLERMGGEDRAYVYVDSNVSDDYGALIKGIDISPDYKIQIKGIYGRITKREICSWEPGWNCTENVQAAKDESRMEISANISGISSSEMSVVFAVTDWKHRGDSTEPATRSVGSRGQVGPEPNAPTWPTSWISVVTDPDEGFPDPSTEILEVYFYMDSTYLYVRIRTESTVAPTLTDNTWWIYLDTDGDGSNDWIVVEMSGTGTPPGEVHGLAWNGGTGQWGGTGSDWQDTIDDSDDDSAVRTAVMTIGLNTYGCVDFAVLRTNIGSIDDDATIAAADSVNEDEPLSGKTERSPDQSLPYITDATGAGQIPEFETVLLPVLLALIVPTVIIKRRKRYSGC